LNQRQVRRTERGGEVRAATGSFERGERKEERRNPGEIGSGLLPDVSAITKREKKTKGGRGGKR